MKVLRHLQCVGCSYNDLKFSVYSSVCKLSSPAVAVASGLTHVESRSTVLASTLATKRRVGVLIILLDAHLLRHAPILHLLLLLQIVRPLCTHWLSGVSDVLTDDVLAHPVSVLLLNHVARPRLQHLLVGVVQDRHVRVQLARLRSHAVLFGKHSLGA